MAATRAGVTAARILHDRGLHVFPVDHPNHPQCIGKHGPDSPCDGHRGKHPAVKWGVWSVTVTPQMIDLEWGKHRGLANIGVACGPSNLVVLDEDRHSELDRWCITYGITLPDTYTVTTARGRHLYFRWDHGTQRIGNSPKAVEGFKIDVRGDGGFVVGEGSRHADGELYTGNGHEVADLPAEVAALLLEGAPTHGQPPEHADQPTWVEVTEDHQDTKIGFHHRHNTLVAYAGRLRKSGLDRAEAEPTFRQRWLLCEQPEGQIPEARYHSPDVPYPVTWAEAEGKLRDVFTRYAAGQNLNGDTPTGQPDGDPEAELDDPIPLTGSATDLPSFPVDALPTVIANMVTELAEATQTDPAMPGTSALTVLAACAGGHAKIQVRSGWCEPLCLHTNTIARPGERKSAVQEAMVAPLHDAEAELSVAGEMERLKLADELDMAKGTVDKLNRAAVDAAAKAAQPGATAKDKDARESTAQAAKDAKAAMREIQVPVVPRLLADDVTPEATASLLAEHHGRISIISSEGGIFETIAGRYSRAVNMDVFLKGHSGDRIRVDRQGRPAQHIPSPALTMGLMVQPRVIETIATNRDFVGRGLLARFLYAVPVSKVGSRVSAAAPVSKLTESTYSNRIKRLASDLAGWAGDPALLVLDAAAEAEVRRIQDDVEPTLVGDGELSSPASLTEWGSKYVGAVVRIAGLLHLAERGADPGVLHAGINHPVNLDTIRGAERIGRYFKAAAINVFTGMADPNAVDARYLLDRAVSLGHDEVSERDMFTACSRSRFPTKADMQPALRRLIDHGYLLPADAPKPTGGRPASPKYRVHSASAKAAEAAEGSP